MTTTTIARVHNAGPLEGIPLGEGRNIRIDGEEIAIFRTRLGEVYAVQAACPHRGGPLADGMLGGSTIVCPLHSHAFELATGESVRGGCPALATYRVTVGSAGDLLVSLPGEGGGHG
jgi:nitrite reductase (NADH) small subunit